jgi:hypothetical protein
MFAVMNQLEAMETYFVVIELPGGDELRFLEGKYSPENFWPAAVLAVNNGEAQIICSREDTGVSEDLRKHISTLGKFTTFILAQISLCSKDIYCEKTIYRKTADWITFSDSEMVIDADNNFQLVTLEAA